jgi:uncharacterized protein YhdP
VQRSARARLRLAGLLLGGVTILGAVAWVAFELAVARVPQHRAALEELIRRETGLEVSFSGLTVGWGWYGPEAVFHSVVLGEPGTGAALLRAPRLIVGLDAWRMLRSGELEAGRITLVEPDVDLGAAAAGRASARSAGEISEPVLSRAARLLSRWRGGRIDLEGGTIRWPLTDAAALPLAISVRHAQLRRLASSWNADALVLLPANLGTSAHLAITMQGDPVRPQTLGGTLAFEGRGLEFSGWHAVSPAVLVRGLPQGGRGDLELRSEFAAGQLLRADGKVSAEGLEWRPPAADGAAALTLPPLHGSWQLARLGNYWHLEAQAPGLDAHPSAPLLVSFDAAANGETLRGRVQGAPLPLIAALAHSFSPRLPLAELALSGLVRELTLDWDARRPAGERLRSAARIEDLGLASAAHGASVSGLTAQVSGREDRLLADVHGAAAQLSLSRARPLEAGGFAVAARLALAADAGGWQLSSDDLEIRHAQMSLAASGTLGARAAAAPRLEAHVALKDADVAWLGQLLGPEALAALGPGAAQLTAGRIASADLEWRGSRLAADSRGAFELRGASLAALDPWPGVRGLDARLEWRGARMHAAIERAAIDAGGDAPWQLTAARAAWDARGQGAARLTGRLAGRVEPLLAWAREHPALAARAPGLTDLDLRGTALLDVEVRVPTARGGGTEASRRPAVRIAAALGGVEWRPLAGVPPLEALHGTLAFAGGHLQPSTLTGQWLGGPVTLAVGERREAGLTTLAIAGRGSVDVRAALRAAGAGEAAAAGESGGLSGSAEWSALFSAAPAQGSAPRWRVRADSTLAGLGSTLPDPLGKAPGASLPLHVELQAGTESGQLLVSLGERLRAWAALKSSGELWRIERGTVRLGGAPAALPVDAVLQLEGRVGRLDLPAALALWRQAGRDAALPALHARLTVGELFAGTRSFPEVGVAADASVAGAQLQLESAELLGTVRSPPQVSAAHPVLVHFERLEAAPLAEVLAGPALLTALGPAVQLTVDELRWQGRPLGRLAATLAARAQAFEVSALHFAGDHEDAQAALRCQEGSCRAQFTLDSRDAAATLAALGLRPELDASHAQLQGELRWPQRPLPSLATLDGRLHMAFEQGVVREAGAETSGVPFALLAVPALAAGLRAEHGAGERGGLDFSSLTADYTVHEGEATTSNLHFDGDAEILVRGRAGLIRRDYDAQAWILRGEERLPSAVRRLAPGPKVAAVWLSLRELVTGSAAARTHTALRLRGSWDEPRVSPAE